jgi:DNA-binding CsgD family transcriptional regulator
MTATPEFHALVERIEAFIHGKDSPEAILALIAQTYRMSHAAYLGLDLPYEGKCHFIFHATYPKHWIDRYIEQNYFEIDPTIATTLKSTLPIDWSELPSTNREIRSFLHEAHNFGIGSRAISVPIRGRQGEKGLFTLVGDIDAAEWDFYKRSFIPDFITLGVYIHCMFIKYLIPQSYEDNIKLSPREILCLEWASNGKTFNDIAGIIGISNHTVRIHLDAAREKLKCLNITHAVARAIKLELIRAPR